MSLRRLLGAAGACVVLAPLAAHAAGSQADPGAYKQFQQEQAWCKSGKSGQDEAACMKSAAAAYEEARAGRLDTSNYPYQENELARCDPLPPQDRSDCERLVKRAGTQLADNQSQVAEVVRQVPVSQ